MKWWRATHGIAAVTEVEILRATEKQVIFPTLRRSPRSAEWFSFHETEEEAWEEILRRKRAAVSTAEGRLDAARSDLAEAEAMYANRRLRTA